MATGHWPACFGGIMKKFCTIFLLIISSLLLYAQSIIELNSDKIKEENIYIVEDKLNILKSKEDANFYIEKAFIYISDFCLWNIDILRKKGSYSVQLFTRQDGDRNFIYLNFFILEEKDYFNTNEVIVFDGGTDFWNIKFDLKKECFYDLWVNGVA